MRPPERWLLQLSAGRGPEAVRDFLGELIAQVAAGLRAEGVVVDRIEVQGPARAPRSACLHLHQRPAAHWLGTHELYARSPVRGRRSRKRWFVGATLHPGSLAEQGPLDPTQLRRRTCRSGGPGGQHANTRATAVQLVHTPTGTTARAEGERSQAANLRAARRALEQKLAQQASVAQRSRRAQRWQEHDQLERGRPTMRWRRSRSGALERMP